MTALPLCYNRCPTVKFLTRGCADGGNVGQGGMEMVELILSELQPLAFHVHKFLREKNKLKGEKTVFKDSLRALAFLNVYPG